MVEIHHDLHGNVLNRMKIVLQQVERTDHNLATK